MRGRAEVSHRPQPETLQARTRAPGAQRSGHAECGVAAAQPQAARQVSPPHAQVTVRPRRAPQALGPREPPSSCPARSPALVPAASRRPATPQHRTLLARMPPCAHDGTDGGDPAPGVPTSLRARCTCPGLQGFWLRSVRDLGAAARGGAESTNQSAASHFRTGRSRGNLARTPDMAVVTPFDKYRHPVDQ